MEKENLFSIKFNTVPIVKTIDGREADATGFFFRQRIHNPVLYLVTNKHVVENNLPSQLRIKTHTINTFKIITNYNTEITINLYDNSGNKLWLESKNKDVDVVLIPLLKYLTDPQKPHTHTPILPQFDKIKTLRSINYDKLKTSKITCFSEGNFLDKATTEMLPMSDLVIIGYPKGFYDKSHNFPIYKKGMLASDYPTYFNKKPFFIIDANLHPGSSGSPVILHPSNIVHHKTKNISRHIGKDCVLLGIHSADMGKKIKLKDIDDKDKTISDSLNLNRVFYAELILDIISHS